ncbi:hypothetical protein K491DRAFT_501652 [Lophiostoma macrostomum CBS 122681]|uniref:Uncharacterized protein n=1 Tax=Lophiostoma macrostomum CBS 122681 TaxID=1314788 RepID=A0A6A6T3M1_9PLEO|nr:hypothetical protein K491DRAFT_501652 [Lophiostoma macrostomum CBS 122681]
MCSALNSRSPCRIVVLSYIYPSICHHSPPLHIYASFDGKDLNQDLKRDMCLVLLDSKQWSMTFYESAEREDDIDPFLVKRAVCLNIWIEMDVAMMMTTTCSAMSSDTPSSLSWPSIIYINPLTPSNRISFFHTRPARLGRASKTSGQHFPCARRPGH